MSVPQQYPQYPLYQPYQPYLPYQPYPQQSFQSLPTVWPTILVTFFFGLFGLIPTIMHTERARAAGHPTGEYWFAFAVTYLVSLVFVLIVIFGLGQI